MNSKDLYRRLHLILNQKTTYTQQTYDDLLKDLLDHDVLIKKEERYYKVGFKGVWLQYLYERTGGLYV